MSGYRVEIYEQKACPTGRAERALFDWRLKAANGQVMATSHGQGYTTAHDCYRGLLAVINVLGKAFTLDGVRVLMPDGTARKVNSSVLMNRKR